MNAVEMMSLSHKIKIYISNDDKAIRDKQYKLFSDITELNSQIKNRTTNIMHQIHGVWKESYNTHRPEGDQKDIKELQKEAASIADATAFEILKLYVEDAFLQKNSTFKKSLTNLPYYLAKKYFEEANIEELCNSGEIKGRISNEVRVKSEQDKHEVYYGKKSAPSYKVTNPFPVPFANFGKNVKQVVTEIQSDGSKKAKMKTVGKEINLRKEDGKYFLTLNIFQLNGEKIPLVIGFKPGKKDTRARIILDRVLSGEYIPGDSKIKKDHKGEWYFILAYKEPVRKNDLDDNKSLGVDVGLTNRAVISNGDDRTWFVAKGKHYKDTHFAINRNRRQAQKDATMGRSGHGKKRKMKATERWAHKERNFADNHTHKIAKMIVKKALQWRCGVIKLEMLSAFPEKKQDRLFRFYELQQKIKYKAEKEGIKVVFVDPYHTSQTCSKCGHWEEGQRTSRDKFTCKSCGHTDNADANAARNIANSTKIVTKKTECEYFKQMRKKKKAEEKAKNAA